MSYLLIGFCCAKRGFHCAKRPLVSTLDRMDASTHKVATLISFKIPSTHLAVNKSASPFSNLFLDWRAKRPSHEKNKLVQVEL